MSRPVFITWLWNARGGWRDKAGYTPEIIGAVQYMLERAVPGCRHVCISDPEYHPELKQRGIETFPLWETFSHSRTLAYGFDCYARLGLWGAPGLELARYLGAEVVQWIDADVMIRPTAGPTLLDRWDEQPEMFWVPESRGDFTRAFVFGRNAGTWAGINGSMVRLKLGSRPNWWEVLREEAWIFETDQYLCGSDQAAITRLLLEEMGEQWKEPNPAIRVIPHFGPLVVPWLGNAKYDVGFFPYDPHTPSGALAHNTKPWLTNNAYLRREWRVLAGLATEAEQRAESNPALRRMLRRC